MYHVGQQEKKISMKFIENFRDVEFYNRVPSMVDQVQPLDQPVDVPKRSSEFTLGLQ